jgi:hypothetical protein
MFTATQNEIVDMAAAEIPPADGQAELNAAMAKERETLPSPADLIAQHRANLKEQGVSVSSGPTQRPSGRQPQRGLHQ